MVVWLNVITELRFSASKNKPFECPRVLQRLRLYNLFYLLFVASLVSVGSVVYVVSVVPVCICCVCCLHIICSGCFKRQGQGLLYQYCSPLNRNTNTAVH